MDFNQLTPDDTAELERLQKLLEARTNPDGTARAGYKHNTAHIQARVAQLQKKGGESFVVSRQ
jgi:hypothetical protein